ncbi:hypothetical protein QYR02_02475 [Microbacterium maritypicum]|uniref:hypothetical protein n=1 Tax=Microbacterium maritypicum TaxID=33918 RepID=UPI002671E93D|nr:hypothetical protein [Microbacterium liquefaciens]WKT89799.1 hypothetical protein QYR02_02475 [Microbacterium liquefaciens]
MTIRQNAAYFGTTGKLTAESDDYTAAVTSCALVPTAPTATTTDIGGGVTQFVGGNAWAAQIAYNQDWTTPDSLSQKLIEWHGQVKTFTYTPDDGGQVATFQARVLAGQFGGGAATIHSATVNLPIDGQPTFAAPVGG